MDNKAAKRFSSIATYSIALSTVHWFNDVSIYSCADGMVRLFDFKLSLGEMAKS
jgi:hypothetical protein